MGRDTKGKSREVLSRAGEVLAGAIEKLQTMEEGVDERLRRLTARSEGMPSNCTMMRQRQGAVGEINGDIDTYNRLREHAKLRYYCLIVTREAMGLRRHDRVEEIYGRPDRKGHLHDDNG